jgi:hypothetical protein
MLNPQIRGLLGIMLIVIPIVGVGMGILSIQNPETIISLPSEQHPYDPPNGMRYVIASSDVPPVYPSNYLAQSFVVNKEYQSIDSIHLALMTNDYGSLDAWQEINVYIVEGNSLDEFESGQNSPSPTSDPVLRGIIRVMNIPNENTFTHKSSANDRFTEIIITENNKELLIGHFYYIYIPKEEWRTSTFRGWVAWVRNTDSYVNGHAWYAPNEQTGSWIREDNAKDFSFKIVGTPKAEQPPPPPEEKGWIEGTVYKYHGSGVVLVGATVTADGYTTTTNSLGKYSLEVNVGMYTVTVSKDGYYSSEIQDVSISDGQTSTQDFYLELIPDDIDTGVVSGYVYKEDSTTALSNVNIIATKGGDIIIDTTDSNGYYSLTLPIGSWIIKANKTGYYDSFETITISETPISQGFFLEKIPTNGENGDDDDEEDEEEDEVISTTNWNMLFLTAFVIAIGVVLLLSCMTMNVIVLFIGFAGSALAWILYNTSLGGLF